MATLTAPALAPSDLSATLERHILGRTGRRVRDLGVEVRDGRIVLTGHATTYYVKQLAQHCVWDLLPQARLDNQIAVDLAGR